MLPFAMVSDLPHVQVVSAPVIGKVAQVGIERVVGTIIGGCTGYAVYILGSQVWNPFTDGEPTSSKSLQHA